MGVAHHLVAIVPVDGGFPAARQSNTTHPLLLVAPAASAQGANMTRATKDGHDVLVSPSKTDKQRTTAVLAPSALLSNKRSPSHGVVSTTTALRNQVKVNSSRSNPSHVDPSRVREERVLNSVVAWVSVVTWDSTPEISAIDWQNVAPNSAVNVYRQVRATPEGFT